MLQQAKMPHARFSTEAVAIHNAEGHTEYINKYFVTITPAGGKDEVYKEAESWLNELRQKSQTRGPFDAAAAEYDEWYKRFSAMFKAYKEGNEIPLDGHSLKMFPAFTPAEISNCSSLHLYTLEALADCNEEAIRRLGTGGRTLKQKAQKLLENQQGGRVAEENAALRLKVAELEEKLNALINKSDINIPEPSEAVILTDAPKKRGPKPKVTV